MKQSFSLFFIIAFASSIVSAKMPNQIKATRNFTADKIEIATPVYKIGELKEEELNSLKSQFPDLDVESVRFYIITDLGVIKPFQFKVDKSSVETKTDYADLGSKIAGKAVIEVLNSIYSSGQRGYRYYENDDSTYHVISPIFYYGNDFEDLRDQEIKDLYDNQIGATITALFGGFLAGTFGVITVQSIKNKKLNCQVSSNDFMCAVAPGAVAFSAMTYQMYSEQANRYLQITKREYLQVRKLYPEIDCDSFSVTHPIKNFFLRSAKYLGICTAISGAAYLCKSYITAPAQL